MFPFRLNARILSVERAGALDRYGVAQLETVVKNEHCHLEETTRLIRTVNGDTVQIDGSVMMLSQLQTGDLITIADRFRSQFKIFNRDEAQDIVGLVLYYTYGLTKQRGQDAAN